MDARMYDHYVAVDWSIKNMAIARMTAKSNKITVVEAKSDVGELQAYLTHLRGTKILAIEETTTSQWLYTELTDYVDRIVVCDPHRNKLLNEGPKTDKIDASKLVQLLKANLLKEVYHSQDRFLHLKRSSRNWCGTILKSDARRVCPALVSSARLRSFPGSSRLIVLPIRVTS